MKRYQIESWLRYHENLIEKIKEIREENEPESIKDTFELLQELDKHKDHAEMIEELLELTEEPEEPEQEDVTYLSQTVSEEAVKDALLSALKRCQENLREGRVVNDGLSDVEAAMLGQHVHPKFQTEVVPNHQDA